MLAWSACLVLLPECLLDLTEWLLACLTCQNDSQRTCLTCLSPGLPACLLDLPNYLLYCLLAFSAWLPPRLPACLLDLPDYILECLSDCLLACVLTGCRAHPRRVSVFIRMSFPRFPALFLAREWPSENSKKRESTGYEAGGMESGSRC